MTNYSTYSIEELEQAKDLILKRNAHWLSCQDGSYECALHHSGYDDVVAELIARKSKITTYKLTTFKEDRRFKSGVRMLGEYIYKNASFKSMQDEISDLKCTLYKPEDGFSIMLVNCSDN